MFGTMFRANTDKIKGPSEPTRLTKSLIVSLMSLIKNLLKGLTVDGGKFASEIAFLCRKSALRDLQGTFKGPTRNLQGIAYIP